MIFMVADSDTNCASPVGLPWRHGTKYAHSNMRRNFYKLATAGPAPNAGTKGLSCVDRRQVHSGFLTLASRPVDARHTVGPAGFTPDEAALTVEQNVLTLERRRRGAVRPTRRAEKPLRLRSAEHCVAASATGF